jgi:L-alanine-DL-glutamate epimerase-like enolase superfamily enzyme
MQTSFLLESERRACPCEHRACTMTWSMNPNAPIRSVNVGSFTLPTDQPEADGTIEWKKTTLVLARVAAGDHEGIGYSYANPAAARVIKDPLREAVIGRDAFDTSACWEAMLRSVRNFGLHGVAAHAISAVDIALWDLKAKLLQIPLFKLLGAARDRAPIYGSGGFTSYSVPELQKQLAGWVEAGIPRVKMKVGSKPAADVVRVRAARQAIGNQVELFVDANGAYDVKQAFKFAIEFRELGVTWFEEPVSSDNLEGLRRVRDTTPPGMNIVAGEYGYDSLYFRKMLTAGAVDVLQADATRCLGVSGWLRAAHIAESFFTPLSGHTAPAIHTHLSCVIPGVQPLEYFHDHVRIEHLLFDGGPELKDGMLVPDPVRPGLGLELKLQEANRYAA